MKNLYRILLAVLLLLPQAIRMYAAETDGEGYPVFYMRGSDYSNWAAVAENRMTREGDVYKLHMTSLSGEFKISNDDWTLNYGAEAAKMLLEGSVTFTGIYGGGNIVADRELSDVTVTLIYDRSNPRVATVTIVADGIQPDIPGISGTLPVLYVNVYDEQGNPDNEIIDMNLSHKNYFSGEYWLDLNGCEWMQELGAESVGSREEPLPLEIKARGNWTRKGFSKKPYKLKLGKKQSLLGLSKSKHFAILAHADDNYGYLRNYTGFNLGRRIGLPWTPSQQPVEVVINGDYRGLYFLTESIRIDKDRIDITELADNEADHELISGGYLVELDNYDEPEESQIRMREKGGYPGYKDMLRVTFDTPEVYSEIQRRFITDQFTAINDLVGENSDALWSYLDLDDAARYYLVCELVSHVEAYHGSTYLFRDRGEGQKWHFSPLWDFGNAFNGPTDGYIYDNAPYGMTWAGSFTLNEKFRDKVAATWRWFMQNGFNGIREDMKMISERLESAARADHRRWKGQPVPEGGQPVCDNSDIMARYEAALAHLDAKTDWLRTRFGEYSGEREEEPERDATPAAPLPEYALSGVELPAADAACPADARIYNLQGLRVSRPRSGEVYIEVTAAGSRKFIAR